ncbi:MAG: peptide-methionine (S)-S-oxide reductase MsrA [Pyrinomonadaceae bacterium]
MRKILRYLIAAVVLTGTFAISTFAAEQKAIFAGGCFWGVEAVFEHVKGVIAVRSGYAGGAKETADYADVSSGATKHAESVEIRFDPAKVTYEQLLNVFFVVAHDPTEVNRQGPDTGTQYRSAIFYSGENQQKSADAFIAALNASKAFDKPLATEVTPLTGFFEAEEHHQNYLKRNPDDPYIVYNDLPKLKELKIKFPALYRPVPAP